MADLIILGDLLLVAGIVTAFLSSEVAAKRRKNVAVLVQFKNRSSWGEKEPSLFRADLWFEVGLAATLIGIGLDTLARF